MKTKSSSNIFKKFTSVLTALLSLTLLVQAPAPNFAADSVSELKIIENELLSSVTLEAESEGFILFYDENGKYGFMNTSGVEIIKPEYDYAESFKSGLARVTKDGKVMYIDGRGVVQFYEEDVLSQYNLDEVSPEISYFSEGFAKVDVYSSMSYINTKGEFVFAKDAFYDGYDFSDGLVQVFDEDYNSKYIDDQGNTAFETDSNFEYYGFSNGLARIYSYDSGQYGFIDKAGKVVIPLTLDYADDFVGDLAVYEELGKYGVINKKGKFLILPSFEDIEITSDGHVLGYDGIYTVVVDSSMHVVGRFVGNKIYSSYDNVIIDLVAGAYAFKDLSGNVLGTFDDYYALGDGFFTDGYGKLIDTRAVKSSATQETYVKRDDYDFFFLDNEGNVAIDLSSYDNVRPFSEGRAVVEKNGKYGYIDTDGDLVIGLNYTSASDFADGEASVETASTYAIIDLNGKEIESAYDDYYDYDLSSLEEDYYVISTGYYGDSGVANRKTNKILLEPVYYDITALGEGYFELMDENYNYGFYNANNKTLIEPQYAYVATYIYSNLIEVETEDGKHGLLDLDGKTILEPMYDYISVLSDKLYMVEKDGLYGVADRKGNLLIRTAFDYIYSDYITDDIMALSTELGYDTHVMIYDLNKMAVLSDTLEGRVVAYGDDYIVVTDYYDNTTMASLNGKIIYKTTDYQVDSDAGFVQFESDAGVNYLVDTTGKKYLENNDFAMIYLPVSDEHIIFYDGSGFGIANLNGKVKTKKVYDNVSYINSGVMAYVSQEAFGYVDLEGNPVVEEGKYDYLYNFTDGLGLVIKMKK